jgi:(E)-4-hydroxy-3-methylbut-2-enyl-diphosphate synthase
MKRRKTRKVKVGNVYIGGDSSVSVQGMAKVPTSELRLLVGEVKNMVDAGAEIVRIAILNRQDTNSIPELKKRFKVPVVADIHYKSQLALLSMDRGADKIRINPGNMSAAGLKEVIKKAKSYNIPIRAGLNSGSIEIRGGLVKSMLETAKKTIALFRNESFESLVLSLKTPYVRESIELYREISRICDYPLHLGITEAGRGYLAESKSILGTGILLSEGIGDTLRVSLTDRASREIKIGRAILQSLELRRFEPEIISCPTCGRIQVDLKKILPEVQKEIGKLSTVYPEVKNLKIAVMGCSVNGPGEAKQADVGIAGGKGKFILFKKGDIIGSYDQGKIIEKLKKEIEKIVKK